MSQSNGFKRGFLTTTGDGKGKSLSSKASLQPYRGLPTELIDQIFLYCDRDMLLRLAVMTKRFYLCSMRLLYETFLPVLWTDIVVLRRRLQNGFGPQSVNRLQVAHSVAENIRTIKIPAWWAISLLRDYEFGMLETVESLVQITSKTVNIHSFQWSAVTFTDDLDDLWRSLRSTSIKEITLGESISIPGASIYRIDSEFWRLTQLTKVHLQFPSMGNDSSLQLIPGLVKLLRRCPTLQDLAVRVVAEGQSPYLRPVACLNGDALFTLPIMAKIEKLDLQDILATDGAIMRRFLASLQKVQHLRLVQNYIRKDSIISSTALTLDVSGNHPILLPALQTLETSANNLVIIAPASLPTVLGNTHANLSSPTINSLLPRLCSFLPTIASVKEFHLVFDGCTTSMENRPKVIAVLKCIPISVERLAIRMPHHTDRLYLELEDESERSSFLEPLGRLKSLKKVNVPWSAILYSETAGAGGDDDDDHNRILHPEIFYQKLFQRATDLAQRLAVICPKLVWVFFQGSSSQNSSGNPAWEIKWGEEEEIDRRWIIKIDRHHKMPKKAKQATFEKNGTKGKEGGRSDSQNMRTTGQDTGISSGSDKQSDRSKTDLPTKKVMAEEQKTERTKERESITVTFNSTSCLCPRCYKNELTTDNKDCLLREMQVQTVFDAMLAAGPEGLS